MIRRTSLAVVAGCTALVLAGCGGGGGSQTSSPGAGGTGSAAPATGSAAPTKVDGVTLTPPGTALRLGSRAVVSWQPDQRTTGVIGVAVTSLERLPISTFSSWQLDRATRRSTPYFVKATVENLGRSNLGGATVPLYLLDKQDTLLQPSTFQAQFAPCPSRPLPTGFTHGRRTKVCLVYFVPAHGTLVAVSFRPAQQFDAITWRGPVTAAAHAHHKKKKH